MLSLLDYSKFSVDLMLFAHGTLLEKLVPKQVNILKTLQYTKFSNLNIKEALLYSVRNADFRMLSSRIKYSLLIRKEKYKDENVQKARIYWQSVSDVIESNPESYDVAISYSQGIPTFYVADKIKAKKIAWVNTSYKLDEKEKKFQKKFYDCYNKIVAVSSSAKEILLETFPNYSDKVKVIYDINNPKFIYDMSILGDGYDDKFDGIRILTIGRLAEGKGYDIALEACKKLREKGINFRWYALGKGPLKEEIESYIKENDLVKDFILLGVESNPYPYIRNADIYVQTSRFEGFGLAIAEARMLNIPVVTTRFDAVNNQMIDGKNGIVVNINSEDVSQGIQKLINDDKLRENIVKYLQLEKKGNIEELEKFYEIVE
ncbi:glycosyltransferase [Metabacillus endolithicus]|uniref:glycosyltransferase n=1 Tax=Metabacillus endolithicus TaxID=1535204 RepID=UPI001FF83F5C|nr:glycosyltransferase [Metabacillus endolithicus]UPG64503.1 glycosyltransferase [Metabacillus endolithicus]